jgi:hypothetical protein
MASEKSVSVHGNADCGAEAGGGEGLVVDAGPGVTGSGAQGAVPAQNAMSSIQMSVGLCSFSTVNFTSAQTAFELRDLVALKYVHSL